MKTNMLKDDIKVEAFNESTGMSAGKFDSISKCSRTLFVSYGTIWGCLFKKGRFTGSSRKTKIKYSFKAI